MKNGDWESHRLPHKSLVPFEGKSSRAIPLLKFIPLELPFGRCAAGQRNSCRSTRPALRLPVDYITGSSGCIAATLPDRLTPWSKAALATLMELQMHVSLLGRTDKAFCWSKTKTLRARLCGLLSPTVDTACLRRRTRPPRHVCGMRTPRRSTCSLRISGATTIRRQDSNWHVGSQNSTAG